MAYEYKKCQEEILEQRKVLVEMNEKIDAENRAFTAEELAEWDNHQAKIEELEQRAATAKRIETLSQPATEAESRAIRKGENQSGVWSKGLANAALKGQMLMAYNYEPSTEQRHAMQRCGLAPHTRLVLENRANMSIGAPTAGGYLTQELLYNKIIEAIAAHGGLLSLVSTEATDKGSDLRFPLADNTTRKAVIRAENGPQVPANMSVGSKLVPTFTYTDSVKASVELLRDSQFDIVGFMTRNLGSALAVAQEEHISIGAGTTEPFGLLARTDSGATTDDYNHITYEDLLDMEASINPAVIAGGNCKWVFSPSALRSIKGLVNENGDPLWMPSLSVGAPNTVLGYAYVVDSFYDVMGEPNNKVATFGDHSYYIRRVVGGIEVGVDPYTVRASEGNIQYFVEQAVGGDFCVASSFKPVKHLTLGANAS